MEAHIKNFEDAQAALTGTQQNLHKARSRYQETLATKIRAAAAAEEIHSTKVDGSCYKQIGAFFVFAEKDALLKELDSTVAKASDALPKIKDAEISLQKKAEEQTKDLNEKANVLHSAATTAKNETK